MRGVAGYLGVVALAFGFGDIVAASIADASCRSAGVFALDFNTTNVDALVHCMQYTYECRGPPGSNETFWSTSDNTKGEDPTDCYPARWHVAIQWGVNGSFSIPKVVSAYEVSMIGAGWCSQTSDDMDCSPPPEEILNITSLELPDLVATPTFRVYRMHVLQSLKVPKLERTDTLDLDLGGLSPSISLDFPSLSDVGYIHMHGNIDAISLPVLNTTSRININSTGNLDCTAFVASVYNATTPTSASDERGNNTIICNSKSASITTFHPMAKQSSAGQISTVGIWMVALGVVGSLSFGL